MAVNSMDHSGKDTVVDVVRTERATFYGVIDDPDNWYVQTRCAAWEVRDIAGHMIDVTEGYLSRWDMARNNEPADALGLLVMGETLNDHAQAFRSVPREEVIARLKSDSDKMLAIFDSLTADEWGGFNVTHPYMGPLPTFFYPAFHVMDYGVHTWDMNWGLGQKDAKLDDRTAGVLVPYMVILMQVTVDPESATDVDDVLSLKLDGQWRLPYVVCCKQSLFAFYPQENLEGEPALSHFNNASDFVLTTFQRFPGGETSGDPKVIDQVRHLFFRI